jgi:hypothetical protein
MKYMRKCGGFFDNEIEAWRTAGIVDTVIEVAQASDGAGAVMTLIVRQRKKYNIEVSALIGAGMLTSVIEAPASGCAAVMVLCEIPEPRTKVRVTFPVE